MNPKYAKYPFLEGAKDELGDVDISINDIFIGENNETAKKIRERALERVLTSIKKREVGDMHSDPVIEFLSYPASRILVSTIKENSLTNRYATAEAKTASNRVLEDMRTVRDEPSYNVNKDELLNRDELISEFELNSISKISTTVNGQVKTQYEISVCDYLPLANNTWGDGWDLINKSPNDGIITINSGDIDTLLKAAIKKRIKSGRGESMALPFEVPQPIKDSDITKEMCAEIHDELDKRDLITEIDSVVPDLFPPCMKKLLSMLQEGEPLNHHSRVALGTFFVNIGMTTDESIEMMEVHPDFDEGARYHMDHLSGDTGPVTYNVPACSTMKSYGDCHNPDSLCEKIKHPMAYYEKKLEDSDADDYTDWREQQNEDTEKLDESGDVPVFNPNASNNDTKDTEKENIEPKKAEDRNETDDDAMSAVSDDGDVDVFDPSSM